MFDTKNITIEYNFTFKGLPVRPGMSLKVKGIYGLVRFECIVHNMDTGKDYLLVHIGKESRMVQIERLMDVVVLKRTIRKKINESRTANC